MKNQNEVIHQYGLHQTERNVTKCSGEVGLFTIDDTPLDGKHITINGKKMLHFGSCIYTGLEIDSRLKEGAIEAVLKYGTHFCSSRTYVSVAPYSQAEELLGEMFECPVIIAPSITLAHQSCIPILVEENDAVLIDSRAHESLQMPIQLLELRNIHIESLKHNDLHLLEEKIVELKATHKKIWYIADGVYSMFGDFAPVKELVELLKKYEQFNVYLDDAHGISWIGKHGTGYVATFERHERLFLITSLAKGFGCTGAAIVIQDEKLRTLIRKCGTTLIFSNPLPPAVLGAIIASAKIHMTDEIYQRQREVQKRIAYFNNAARLYGLPLVLPSNSPINFLGAGKNAVGFNLTKRLFQRGFYTNWCAFPSVPVNQSGVRILVNYHHSLDDIDHLLAVVAEELPNALAEEGSSIEELCKLFKMSMEDLRRKDSGAVQNFQFNK